MPQTGPDLVSAGFPTSFPLTALLGAQQNATQPNLPPRSNLEWLSLNSAASNTVGTSGVGVVVAVPVTPGHVITKVVVNVTTTAASVPTHSFAALYSGTGSAPALIAQTTDAGSAAIAGSAPFSWTFATPVSITPLQAPYGFVYALYSITATTLPTVATVAGPSIAAFGTTQLSWATNAPVFLASTAGSALAGTAASTIASPAYTANVPVVYLL